MKVTTLLGAVAIALYVSSCSTAAGAGDTPDGYISKDSANKMIGSYLTSIEADSTDEDPDINSLIVDADLLRDYLSNKDVKNVKIMLAHTLDYINSGHGGQNAGYKADALTIVLAGYDAQGNYVFQSDHMVPDHATPCPRNCPSGGSAANALLQ
jgi:hypothetical protein